MHVDWQQMIALGIVAAAAAAVGRRLWGQIAAFRGKPGRGGNGFKRLRQLSEQRRSAAENGLLAADANSNAAPASSAEAAGDDN